jgi:two-component sensor histidine kinase
MKPVARLIDASGLNLTHAIRLLHSQRDRKGILNTLVHCVQGLGATGICIDSRLHGLRMFDASCRVPVRLPNSSSVAVAMRSHLGTENTYITTVRPQSEAGETTVARIATLALIPTLPCTVWRRAAVFWTEEVSPDPTVVARIESLMHATALLLETRERERLTSVAAARHRRRALEMQHRIRNIFALVRSIIRHSADKAASVEDFSLHLLPRIGAVARAHNALMTADGGVELEDLCREEMLANAVREQSYSITGPPLRLREEKQVTTLALAIHELTTNALKFGALRAASGRVHVAWRLASDPNGMQLRIVWREQAQLDETARTRAGTHSGFGREVIERTLPYELNAETRFTLEPTGLVCSMTMPLYGRGVPTRVLSQGQSE